MLAITGEEFPSNVSVLISRDDAVVAAVSLNYDPAVSAVAQRLIAGKVITKEEAQYVAHIYLFPLL